MIAARWWSLALAACGRFGFADGPDGGKDGTGDVAAPIQCALVPTVPTGTEYFVGPAGSDGDPGTGAQPWATFMHAWSVLQPGDTLTLLDGTYFEELTPTMSGTPSAPILIRAQHDGAAVIDGQNIRPVCWFAGPSVAQPLTDLIIEGLSCVNPPDTAAGGETAVLVFRADRIKVRRVTARGVGDGVFELYLTNDILLEDVAAYGGGVVMYTISASARPVIRRCYARWATGPGANADLLNLQDVTDAVVENCVLTQTASPGALEGIVLESDSVSTNDDHFFGDVVEGNDLVGGGTLSWSTNSLLSTGAVFRDFASIGPMSGIYQRDDASLLADRVTLKCTGSPCFGVNPNAGHMAPEASGFTLQNSVLATAAVGLDVDPTTTLIDHHDNVFDTITTLYAQAAVAGANEQALHPSWETATYGDGAYLMRPPELAHAGVAGGPAGAEILYRTVDGVITTTPLWPWPLEARILAESGTSVTWESAGGIWRAPPPVTCP